MDAPAPRPGAEQWLARIFADDRPREIGTGGCRGSNFAPRARWLERWIAMPRFHHWHHAVEPKGRAK